MKQLGLSTIKKSVTLGQNKYEKSPKANGDEADVNRLTRHTKDVPGVSENVWEECVDLLSYFRPNI